MKHWYNLLLISILSILYLVVVALWIAIPEELTLNLAVSGFAMALTLIALYMNKEKLSVFYQSHYFKNLQESLVYFFLLFCLMGVGNYWAYKHPIQADLSVIKINSLSDQTKNILKSLNEPITFKMFARKQESLVWMALLEMYRTEKNSITIEKIDIDVRPDLVGDYQISDTATLVVEYSGKRQKVVERDELNITNALIKISRPGDPVAYFVQGHGEPDINSNEAEGIKLLFLAAKNSAVDIRPLNLLSTQEIPFDAKALILWGPKTRLQDSEINVLKRFLERKGHLLLALDPDLNGDKHENLRALMRSYKIIMRNDLVVDKKSFVNGSNGSIPLVDHFDHEFEMTKNFKGQVFFPLVSSLEIIPNEITPSLKGDLHALASTTAFPDSWGETSLKEMSTQNMIFTAGKDQAGPLNLALAFDGQDNRIVAFGNSSFVLNAYSKFGSNFAFFLNALSWTLGEDRLISFNLPIVQSEPVFISSPQLGIIFYFSVLFSPLVLFGLAVFMYRRRRDK